MILVFQVLDASHIISCYAACQSGSLQEEQRVPYAVLIQKITHSTFDGFCLFALLPETRHYFRGQRCFKMF